MQSPSMKTDQAAEHLQTIRTLMERSALYRRALAPIMIFCGFAGMAGGIAGWTLRVGSSRGFALLWMGVAVFAVVGAFLLVRRQAVRESEPFWSPPTRRVALALAPAFLAGVILTIPFLILDWHEVVWIWWLPVVWTTLYGLALHSAGFFMPRGIRLFGWGFVLCGMAMFIVGTCLPRLISPIQQAHLVMGIIFGGLHLAYGTYLYLTEQRKNAA